MKRISGLWILDTTLNISEHPKSYNVSSTEDVKFHHGFNIQSLNGVRLKTNHDAKPQSVKSKLFDETINSIEDENGNNLETKRKLSRAEASIATRMKRIKTLCNKLGDPYYHSFHLYFFQDVSSISMSWCPVFKAGSSTWRDFFIDFDVEQDETVKVAHYHLDSLKKFNLGRGRMDSRRGPRKLLYPRETSNSVRFTVVRHPVSRLISHLHKAQNYPYEVKRQRAMWTEEAIVNARTNSSWDDETKTKYRQELTKYVDELEPVVDHAPYSKDNPYLHPPYPIFEEMIDFMIKHREPRVDNKGANGHWRSAIEWCDICKNDFDIIIKLEEEPDELMVLLEKLNLLHFRDIFMKRHNSSSKKSILEKEVLTKYMNLLNEKQIKFLNKMYERDFELLGYEPI